MAQFLRRHSLLFTSAFLLVLSAQLMSASIRDRSLPQLGGKAVNAVLSPLEAFQHEAFQSVRYMWDHYLWLVNLESERDGLLERIRALETQNSRLIEFENENKRLRELVNFTYETSLKGIAAAVIGRDPSNWVKTITINRGSKDGIRPGYPVVDGHAIIGQTTVVTESSSKVLLVTDNSSAVDSLVQSSRAPGISEGNLEHNLKLIYVQKDFVVNVGDRVIASGLDGVFPKGLLVGVVTSVQPNTSGLFQNIELTPSVELDRLEEVLVLQPGGEVKPAPLIEQVPLTVDSPVIPQAATSEKPKPVTTPAEKKSEKKKPVPSTKKPKTQSSSAPSASLGQGPGQ